MSRTKNFKIGTFHGTLNPKESSQEAKLRNTIYLIGNVEIQLSENTSKRMGHVKFLGIKQKV